MKYAIGGVPVSGKSSVANSLAAKLEIPYISTDLIRSYAIEILGREEYFRDMPAEVSLTVENYIGKQSAEEIVKREVAKNNLLAKYTTKFFKSNWDWKDYIVEGTGIQPDEIAKIKDEFEITPVFLLINNQDTIKDRIFSRGLWAEAKEYSDEYKSKEVDWVWLYNSYLAEKVQKYDLPHVYIDEKEVDQIVAELLVKCT